MSPMLAVGRCAECNVEFAVLPHPAGATGPLSEELRGATEVAGSHGWELVVSSGRDFNCPACGALSHLSDAKQFLVDPGGGRP